MYLLTADWHLDDNPQNEYRWRVFDKVRALLTEYEQGDISQVVVLGDIVDRKDRHSAALVNRLLAELDGLPITVLRGNHDTTMHPPCYFDWLPNYISEPLRDHDLLYLPFTATPKEDWKDLHLDFNANSAKVIGPYRAIFMHATVSGARIDHGIVLENPDFPPLPRHIKVYSGDIHHPQMVGNVCYVGAPHPVKFGDDYECRMLLVDEQSFDIVKIIKLDPPRKLMMDIIGTHDLHTRKTTPGDQVKLRLHWSPAALAELSTVEAEVAAWAQARGVTVAGFETIVNTPVNSGVDTSQTPEVILRQYAEHERLTDEVLAVGLELLRDAADPPRRGVER